MRLQSCEFQDRYKNDDTVIKSLNIYLSIQNEDGEILIPVDENGEEVEWVVRNKLGKNNRKLIEDKNLTNNQLYVEIKAN